MTRTLLTLKSYMITLLTLKSYMIITLLTLKSYMTITLLNLNSLAKQWVALNIPGKVRCKALARMRNTSHQPILNYLSLKNFVQGSLELVLLNLLRFLRLFVCLSVCLVVLTQS